MLLLLNNPEALTERLLSACQKTLEKDLCDPVADRIQAIMERAKDTLDSYKGRLESVEKVYVKDQLDVVVGEVFRLGMSRDKLVKLRHDVEMMALDLIKNNDFVPDEVVPLYEQIDSTIEDVGSKFQDAIRRAYLVARRFSTLQGIEPAVRMSEAAKSELSSFEQSLDDLQVEIENDEEDRRAQLRAIADEYPHHKRSCQQSLLEVDELHELLRRVEDSTNPSTAPVWCDSIKERPELEEANFHEAFHGLPFVLNRVDNVLVFVLTKDEALRVNDGLIVEAGFDYMEFHLSPHGQILFAISCQHSDPSGSTLAA